MIKNKPLEFKILNETDNDLVVFKPAGMATQLTTDTKNSSLISQVRMNFGDKFHPELPHRLDRITSGILVVALTKDSLRFHNQNIEAKKWKKYYLARVSPDPSFRHSHDELKKVCGEHKAYLKRKGKINTIVKSGGKPSFLNIHAIEPAPDKIGQYHLLIELLTGRFHQIRAMLSDMGLPLTDDFLYNPKKKEIGKQQQNKENFYLESIILKFIDFESSKTKTIFYKDNPLREPVNKNLLVLIEKIASKE